MDRYELLVEVLKAADGVKEYLLFSITATVDNDLVFRSSRSPAQELRWQADEIERKDEAIRRLNHAMSMAVQGGVLDKRKD